MKKVPMIIYKQDRRDALVITNKDMFSTMIPSITMFKDNVESLHCNYYSVYKLKDVLTDYDTRWFVE